MANLSAKQLSELGDSFLAFAQAVGNYRMQNNNSLSKAQNQRIKDFHWTLLNYADNFYTSSAKLVMNDVQASLTTIKGVTAQINETYHTLQKVQKAIDVAAAGVTLGGAIFSKNPLAVADSVRGLMDAWASEG